MNKTYTILGKTYNLSEYDKNFPIGGDHPIWKFFDDYNVKVIGYDIKNLHDYDLNDMHDNFGIVDTQDTVYPEELESAVLLTGWNDKYPPPVVDTSKSKGGELNGRDRTKILKNLQQPHMPLLKVDASQVKDFKSFQIEMGLILNTPICNPVAKQSTKNSYITAGVEMVSTKRIESDRDSIDYWVRNKSGANLTYKKNSQQRVITDIVNRIYRLTNKTKTEKRMKIYTRSELEDYLETSIGIDHDGFFSNENITSMDDVCLYDPGNNRAKQCFTNNLLPNMAKGQITNIVLYCKGNFFTEFVHDIRTFQAGIDHYISLTADTISRTMAGVIDSEESISVLNEYSSKDYYNIVGVIPTTSIPKHKALFKAKRVLSLDEYINVK